MVRLPAPLAERFRAYAGGVPESALSRNKPPGQARELDPHITVKYGIKTTDPDEVAEVVEGSEPFGVTLGGAGAFHGDGEDVVLKVRVQSLGLEALNRLVCLKLENEDSFWRYRPHVTVAYLRKDPADPYGYRNLFNDSFEGERFAVDRLVMTTPGGNEHVIPLLGHKANVASDLMGRISRRQR